MKSIYTERYDPLDHEIYYVLIPDDDIKEVHHTLSAAIDAIGGRQARIVSIYDSPSGAEIEDERHNEWLIKHVTRGPKPKLVGDTHVPKNLYLHPQIWSLVDAQQGNRTEVITKAVKRVYG